mmetsp:Transcript_33066/g.53034  ORF Transcript_33066/g.53034 Transcript_33066/m.53034 type:complete len:93 (-) Transcript_33066:1847-2125(-)
MYICTTYFSTSEHALLPVRLCDLCYYDTSLEKYPVPLALEKEEILRILPTNELETQSMRITAHSHIVMICHSFKPSWSMSKLSSYQCEILVR